MNVPIEGESGEPQLPQLGYPLENPRALARELSYFGFLIDCSLQRVTEEQANSYEKPPIEEFEVIPSAMIVGGYMRWVFNDEKYGLRSKAVNDHSRDLIVRAGNLFSEESDQPLPATSDLLAARYDIEDYRAEYTSSMDGLLSMEEPRQAVYVFRGAAELFKVLLGDFNFQDVAWHWAAADSTSVIRLKINELFLMHASNLDKTN